MTAIASLKHKSPHLIKYFSFQKDKCIHLDFPSCRGTHIFSRVSRITILSLIGWQKNVVSMSIFIVIINVFYSGVWINSLVPLCPQRHLCLLYFPEWQQFEENLSKIIIVMRFRNWSDLGYWPWPSRRLTFSPGRPLSPVRPGRVWPGGPCIKYNQNLNK